MRILNNSWREFFYTAGNAGNGGNPQPDGIISGGRQFIAAGQVVVAQNPGSYPWSFNITQLCDKADKIGKDTNFRGLTTFNNVLYTTKGSGGNGINTVYFIDTTGKACPTGANPCVPGGVGLPESSATLPTAGIPYDPSLLQTDGVVPYNMCILNGFNQVLAKTTTDVFPFGVWFANANTLYVADEGNGDNTNTHGHQHRQWNLHECRGPDEGRTAEMGIGVGRVEKRLYFAGGAEPRHALYRAWLSDWT